MTSNWNGVVTGVLSSLGIAVLSLAFVVAMAPVATADYAGACGRKGADCSGTCPANQHCHVTRLDTCECE